MSDGRFAGDFAVIKVADRLDERKTLSVTRQGLCGFSAEVLLEDVRQIVGGTASADEKEESKKFIADYLAKDPSAYRPDHNQLQIR